MKPIFLTLLLLAIVFSAPANDLKPLMAVPGEIVFKHDFESGKLSKEQWTPRQKTRWQIENGVLTGLPSSAETQAERAHHKGLEPRGSAPVTPMDFIAKLSIRYTGEKSAPQTPFIEFGHHNCRVQFTKTEGAFLLVDSETRKVASAKDFTFESGKWYHILAEMVGDEFVFQIEDGPVFRTQNAGFPKAADHHVGVAGFKEGKIEIDNFTIWKAEPGKTNPDWSAGKAKIPVFEPVIMQDRVDQLKKKKKAH